MLRLAANSGGAIGRPGPLAEIHKTNSHASTTPAADAERVYFYSSTLGLITVDAATGKMFGGMSCRRHFLSSSGDRACLPCSIATW